MQNHLRFAAFCLLAAIASTCLSPGCKQLDEVLNNEEMQEFHKKGLESGAGLNISKDGQSTGGPAAAQERKLQDPFAPSGKSETYDLIAKRVRCGTDARCTRETTNALRDLGRRAAPGLVSFLASDTPNEMRIEAIRVCGWLQVSAAIEPLKELLASSQNVLQREAAWSLGLIGDPKAIDALAEVLAGQIRLELAEAIYQALGGFNDEKAVNLLAGAMARVTPDLRATIVSALGRTRHESAVAPLTEALNDPTELIRIEAINALASVGGEAAIRALEQAAASDSSAGVRKQANDAVQDLKRKI